MTPETVHGIGSLIDRFDVFLIDQYGVLHDGTRPYPGVTDALQMLRAAGKRIVVVTNSGKRASYNIDRLAHLGIPATMYTALITSGDVAWQLLRERNDPWIARLGSRCLLIGTDADPQLLDALRLVPVLTVHDADFVLLGGDPAALSELDWADIVREGIARDVPLLCSNPDRRSSKGEGRWAPGPGALANAYGCGGGRVKFVGKPEGEIFERALQAAGSADRRRALMIGDSLEHDIVGGTRCGVATLLIASGLHCDDLLTALGAIDTEAAARLFETYGAMPAFISSTLASR